MYLYYSYFKSDINQEKINLQIVVIKIKFFNKFDKILLITISSDMSYLFYTILTK